MPTFDHNLLVPFGHLYAGDRFFYGDQYWTKLDAHNARRHSNESVALAGKGYGHIGDSISGFHYLDAVQFEPPTPAVVTPKEIGSFVDKVVIPTGRQRLPGPIAGRLLEECVEMGLSAGLSAGQIMEHVVNSLHNQALKASIREEKTVFPSQLKDDPEGIAGEAGDIGILLKDLCHVTGVDLVAAERTKFTKFAGSALRVADNGTVYRVKPHVTA